MIWLIGQVCPNPGSDKHINKPFEVCLLPVLLFPNAFGKTKEKVGGKQGIEVPMYIGNVLITMRGKNRKDERNYW